LSGQLNASFITSSPDHTKCPEPVFPEFAFLGRSNVGKSSLINAITGQKMLAKTSSTPGKTRLINHFMINEAWYLVDLPGYGYARASKSSRKLWEGMIRQYLLARTNLMSTFLLIDSRLPLQENDRMVINWFGEHQLHFTIVLTKIDKLTTNQLNANFATIKRSLADEWEELPPFILTSAIKSSGVKEILSFIEDTKLLFHPGPALPEFDQ
jgi:GTP-binding protein